MIDREHDLPIARQAKALNISRGSVYYLPRPVSAADLALMRRIRRSSSAVVILASPNTLGHSPKARLVVTMMEVRS